MAISRCESLPADTAPPALAKPRYMLKGEYEKWLTSLFACTS